MARAAQEATEENHLVDITFVSTQKLAGTGKGEALFKIPVPRLLSKPPDSESPGVAPGKCIY